MTTVRLDRRGLLAGRFGTLPASPVPVLDRDRCLAFLHVQCESCRDSCPRAAIGFLPRAGGPATPRIVADRCTGCGDCLPVCPVGAIRRRGDDGCAP